MKCFRMLHLSECQGMGGSRIFKVTSDNKVRAPQIDTSLMTTELTIWNVDIAEYPDLDAREKEVFRYIAKAGCAVTIKNLMEAMPKYKRDMLRRVLNKLIDRGLIMKNGSSVSTRYELNNGTSSYQAGIPEIKAFMDIAKMGEKAIDERLKSD